LPKPYGVSLLYTGVNQDVDLSDLRVGFNDSGEVPIDNFTAFETSTADNRSVQVKLDFYLLPFLNVFGIVGKIEGEAYVPIGISGDDLLKSALPDVGARCDKPPGTPLRPGICDKDFFVLDNSTYDGYSYGGGLVLAGGWKNKITALDIAPRVGFHFDTRVVGVIAPYIGATYLDTEQDISGTFVVDLNDDNPDVPDTLDIDYTIHQEGANPWNYLVGFN
jgi:hypothetical protein